MNNEKPINKSVKKVIQNENTKIKELVFDNNYSNILKGGKKNELKIIKEINEDLETPKDIKNNIDDWEVLL